jgi:hypothetical protein
MGANAAMGEDQFWAIIEKAGAVRKGRATRDEDELCEALSKELSRLDAGQVRAFADLLGQRLRGACTWDLWGAAYVMMGGCSDDMFVYFRRWLVAQGRATFEGALKNADAALAALNVEEPDMECELESLTYAVDEVLEDQNEGDDEPPMVNDEAEPTGTPFDEEDQDALMERYPKLAAMYWGDGEDGDEEGEDDED